MNLNELPVIDALNASSDHGFVFDAHNREQSQLITRYRGTSVIRSGQSRTVTGWQKSIYHFGGLNREVPVVVTIELGRGGIIKNIHIDEKSRGSQGKRCDFACLQELCNEKLAGTEISELGRRVTSAPDVKCLHLYEILSACSSFCAYLDSRGLKEGTEHEYIAIRPDMDGITAETTHEILGEKDSMRIRMDNREKPSLDENGLTCAFEAAAEIRYNGEKVLETGLAAGDFETVFAQLNRLFSKCHHMEKEFFGIKGRARFFNTPSMTGLFLLTMSHCGMRGGVSRAVRIEKILHYLQTGYGRNPCKGFGG